MCPNELLNKCSDINKPYGNLCFPDAVKNINIKVFHLLSKTNETRCMSVHEKCACKCRLQESVFNDRQRSTSDKCRCICKEWIDKGRSDNCFVSNPSVCVNVNVINHVKLVNT